MKIDIVKQRNKLKESPRVIIKVGSRVLVDETGHPDLIKIEHLVKQIAYLQKQGTAVILVSSGAIAAGVEALGLKKRPKTLPELQMAAAVGQTRLMTIYERLFSKENCTTAQVLLTHGDLRKRARHLNARNTILRLLDHKIIPIINENDVVSVDEIRFGDNDQLAALTAILIESNLLLLLTTINGLQSKFGDESSRIPFLNAVTEETLSVASGKGSDFSLGGMSSKLQSARMAADLGIKVVIANGNDNNVIPAIIDGEDIGTLIVSEKKSNLSKINRRKRWIAFFHRTSGVIIVDEGAEKAVVKQNYSLLAIGIKKIEGNFIKGSLVKVKNHDGKAIAKGLVSFSSDEIIKIMGHKSKEIKKILGVDNYDEVIHRDNLIVLDD
jgi:glutamate 5-kinase